MKDTYDVIVIGAGHAGVEAAYAAARLGRRVLLTTIDARNVAYMACNPSIGGVGKSHLVYEIDALGGLMGVVADKTCIQMRTLNAGNGPAVRALRAQIDKHEYHETMREIMQNTPNITLCECEVAAIITEAGATNQSGAAAGVRLVDGTTISAKSVVVATGVYLCSTILVGHTAKSAGPSGFANATHLTQSLVDLGVRIRRFKTGTPPRVTSQSIDYTKTTPQPPDTDAHFSFISTAPARNVASCHLTYTNERTHQIIRDNLQKSAMYGGLIKGVGARYCPSIEDKIVRFATAARHQIFLEPESLQTDEVYLQGISTSLPADIQTQFVQSIDGLEHADIVKHAYAIEYDCIDSTQLRHTLEHKSIAGLYFAGQVNGTSGYEEAAAQGIVAGANAGLRAGACFTSKNPATCEASEDFCGEIPPRAKPFVLSRTESYIGVLVDDLVTLGTNEPYRMFTSRAEHRLFLRHDNADQRLTPRGRELGLVDDARWDTFCGKMALVEKCRRTAAGSSDIPDAIREIVEIEQKYAGYMARESAKIADMVRCEQTALPRDIDYDTITALRRESQIKLSAARPETLAAAQKISGVTPADINVLLVYLRKGK